MIQMLNFSTQAFNRLAWVNNLTTRFSKPVSMLGLFLTITFVLQCVTGLMLSFSLVSEPMLVAHSRSEEDMEDLFSDDFF